MSTGELAVDAVLVLAGLLTALGVIWRATRPLRELSKGTRLFLVDWFGSEARPGHDAVPGFPERMARVELRTANLAHDFRGELTGRLVLLADAVDKLAATATANGTAVAALGDSVQELKNRVLTHRERNEQQITLLRESVARLEAQVEAARAASTRPRTTARPPSTEA